MKQKAIRLSLLGALIGILIITGCSQGEVEATNSENIPEPTARTEPTDKPLPAVKRPQPTKTEGPNNFKSYKNIKYYKDWILDVYLPLEGDPPYPVLVIFPTFTWIYEYEETGQFIAQQDFAVVVADYDYVRWEKRAACPLAWVQANRSEFGFDPEQIVVFGDGWGSNPAAWLGTVDDPTQFMESCDFSLMDLDAIKGVITWSGFGPKGPLCSSYRSMMPYMYDLSEPEIDEICTELEDTPVAEWFELAGTFGEVGSRYVNMRPLTWQDPSDPPLLLLDFKNNLKIRNSEDYTNQVQALGGRIEFITISEGKAGTLQQPDTEGFRVMWEAIESFLDQVFE
jgi:acetyl esterase/lipase